VFYVLENDSDETPDKRKGREATTLLEAMLDALLWKRGVKKDCRVYDASGTCLYDTAVSNDTLELTRWAS